MTADKTCVDVDQQFSNVMGDGESSESDEDSNNDVDYPESHVCIFEYVYFMNEC